MIVRLASVSLFVAVVAISIWSHRTTPVTVSGRINHTVLFSCGLPDHGTKRERIWKVDDGEPIQISNRRWINPNGSLSVRVQPEDRSIIYQCLSFSPGDNEQEHYVYGISLPSAYISLVRFRPSTMVCFFVNSICGLFFIQVLYSECATAMTDALIDFPHFCPPKAEAFLAQTVENVTVDWGTIYTFPCIFGGEAPRKDIMIFNHKVVNEMQHNVTEDSVVECRVENSLGYQHDIAFIKVRPATYPEGFKMHLKAETEKPTVFTISKRVNDTVLLSCGLPDLGPKRNRSWMLKLKELTPVPGYRWINPNGSLTLRVHAEDSNHLYICTAFVPGTLDRETYVYSISLMVAASLRQSVENVTLDWGSIYTFPCSFTGTGPRNDTMVFNNRVVTETKHNVTEDSVVECRVQNSLGMQHDKAFIRIRPGSKAWAQKFGPPTGDYCQPYSVALNDSSACLPFLNELAESDPQPYLVSRSRLSFAESAERSLGELFTAWDRLLVEKQSYANNELNTSEDSVLVDFDKHAVSFTAWRCVDWAKRLTCALTYPRCRSIDSTSGTASRSNKFYEEHPVCRAHCLAVAGLFCMSRLDVPWNSSALNPLEPPLNGSGEPLQSGWTQLLSVPEAHNDRLPTADLVKHLNNASSCVLHTCSSPLSSTSVESRPKCTRLPLETVFNSPYNSDYQGPDNQSNGDPGSNGRDCLSGNGMTYRGSATMPRCQPWAAFGTQVGQLLGVGQLGGTWPGLSALNIHTFPLSLDTEASSSAVCRNPLGLASKPFCLGPVDGASRAENINMQWSIFLCDDIVPCPVSDSDLNVISRVTVTKNKSAESSGTRVQFHALRSRIVACVLAVAFVCLFIVSYIIWRCSRCGLTNSNSSLFPLEFLDTPDQKTGLTVHTKDESLCEPSSVCRALDAIKEQRNLERRRQLLNRRRRLRHMHPFCQSIASCCYRFGDCLRCRLPLDPSEVTRVVSAPVNASSDATQNAWISTKRRQPVFNPFRLCAVDRQCAKTRSVPFSVSPCSGLSAIERPQFRLLGYGRGVMSRSMVNAEDEDFEAKTLSMKLQKPVAYVANAESDGRTKHLIGSCLYNVCARRGSGLQMPSNACPDCQKVMNRELDREERFDPDDLSQETPNQTSRPSSVGAPCLDAIDCSLDPGFALTQSSIQILDSASACLGVRVFPEKLFNTASMMHLLHPKLKQICYPRSKLIERQRLSKRAFGWIVLAEAPSLDNLVRRYRMLSLTAAERLGLTSSQKPGSSHSATHFELDTERSVGGPLIVVKMLNDDADLETHANFLREAEVLVELSHKNIIELLGVCVPLRPPSLILEYMPYGDLTTLLRHYGAPDSCGPVSPLHFTGVPDNMPLAANGELVSLTHTKDSVVCDKYDEAGSRYSNLRSWVPPKNLTCHQLLCMALDACDAMVYLSDRYYVHRDVAARSFLVGNRFILKLSDFSLCRPIKPHVDLVAKPNEYLPVKWLPVESTVNGVFHIDTDVWAFGVFLWELFSFGSEPYDSLSCDQVVPFLEAGKRLVRPADCPSPVYELMLRCWSAERSERPSFSEIRTHLHTIYTQ